MTKEEAKGYLMNISYQLGTMSIEHLSEKDGEKMREAIEALQQEPCDELDFVQPHKKISVNLEPCDDCISRQAALDKEVYTETSDGWTGWTVDVNDIKELPSVNPAENKGRGEQNNVQYDEFGFFDPFSIRGDGE